MVYVSNINTTYIYVSYTHITHMYIFIYMFICTHPQVILYIDFILDSQRELQNI